MTQLSTYSKPPSERAEHSATASALVIAGVLAAALFGASFGTPQSGSIGETVAPELRSIGMVIAPATRPVRVFAPAPKAATQPSFAFGYLEFDWDPDAPGGVPGFDSWPKHDLSVAETSPRN
jgi:hypothetical protein